VEAHLPDFDGELYGQNAELLFVIRLRDELAFRTVPKIVQQMEKDVAKTREVLGRFRAG
jgi:riboflavin kinase/FMN adenylyltransferase